jgi:iron(III) transport system substrate-binding protein
MIPRLAVPVLLLSWLPLNAGAFDDAIVAAARKEGRVVFYASPSIEATQKICRGFERAYSGIQCEFYRAVALQLFQRFNTEMEAKNVKADVIHSSSVPGFLNAKEKGWLAKYRSPEGVKYLPQFKDKDGYFVAARVIPMGLAYNNKLVSAADAPKAWKDVLDPKWKGKMIVPDPGASGTGLAGFYYWDKTFGLDLIRKFAENSPMVVSSTSPAANAVASGERPVAAIMDSWEVVMRMNKGLPIAINFPKEGVPVAPGPVAVAAGAPNPNAAQLLMHYIISKEGQQLIMDDVGAYSGRTDMPPLKGMPRLEELKLIDIDWAALQAEQSQVVDTYSRILKSGAAK